MLLLPARTEVSESRANFSAFNGAAYEIRVLIEKAFQKEQ